MTKQEILAWTSLVSSVILISFYLIAVWGWPEDLAGYDFVVHLFWKVLGIAVAVEVVLALLEELSIGNDISVRQKIMVQSKSYRNAYYVLMAALSVLIVHIFVNRVIWHHVGTELFLTMPLLTLHLLVLLLFIASLTKSGTELYYYNKRNIASWPE